MKSIVKSLVKRKLYGQQILVTLPPETLEVIDREVSILLQHFLQSNKLTPAQLTAANNMLRGPRKLEVEQYVATALASNLENQLLKERRPSRSVFAAYLLRVGLTAYLQQRNTNAKAAASPPSKTNGVNAQLTTAARLQTNQ